MGVRARRSGSAKLTLPSPPKVVPSSEKSAWFWLMGKSWPLLRAHPFGANTKLMILISDKNGSAIHGPPYVDNQFSNPAQGSTQLLKPLAAEISSTPLTLP